MINFWWLILILQTRNFLQNSWYYNSLILGFVRSSETWNLPPVLKLRVRKISDYVSFLNSLYSIRCNFAVYSVLKTLKRRVRVLKNSFISDSPRDVSISGGKSPRMNIPTWEKMVCLPGKALLRCMKSMRECLTCLYARNMREKLAMVCGMLANENR